MSGKADSRAPGRRSASAASARPRKSGGKGRPRRPSAAAPGRAAVAPLAPEGALFQAIVGHAPAVVSVRDLKGRYLFVNRRFETWTGLKRRDVLGKTGHQIFPKKVADGIRAGDLRVLRTRKPIETEEIYTFGRTPRTAVSVRFPIYDADGAPCAVGAISTDISGRKRAETGFLRLEAAIEALPEYFVLYGPDDRLVICNRRYRELNRAVAKATVPGISFEDHARALVRKGLVPSAVGREEDWLRERLARHRNPRGPFELKRQDGIWILIHEQKLPGIGTVTISTDITERKRAEEALQASETRFRAFVENSPSGLHIKDTSGRYLVFSREAGDRLGRTVADAIGKTAHDLFPREVADAFVAHDREVLETGRTVEREHVVPTAGGLRTRLITKFPIPDASGKIAAIGSLSSDISARKEAEAARARLRDAVEHVDAGIALFDRDDRLVLFNNRYASTNATFQALLRPGMTFAEAMRGAVAAGVYHASMGAPAEWLAKRLAAHRSAPSRHEQRLHDGHWDEVHEYRTHDGGTLIIATDVTEKKRTEEELHQSEARFRAFVAHSPSRINIKDKEGRYLVFSPASTRYWGAPAERAVGRTARDIYPAPLAELFAAQDEEVLRSGRLIEFEDSYTKDGVSRTVLSTKFPIRDAKGEIFAIGIIGTDITARKEAEAARARLSDAIEHVDAGIALFDRDDRLVLCNERFSRRHGDRTRPPSPGALFADMLREAAAAGAFHPSIGDPETWIERRLAYHRAAPSRHEQRLADGGWVELNEFRTRDGGVLVIRTDITERKEAEAARARLSDAIEHVGAGIALFDRDDRLVLCNERFAHRHGPLAKPPLPGTPFSEMLLEAVASGALALHPSMGDTESWIEKRLAYHRDAPSRHEHRLADGRWVEQNEYRTRDGGVLVIRTDITERKRDEEALRQSRALLQAVMDSVPVMVNVKDRESRYLFMNRYQADLYGTTPEAAIGKTAGDLLGEKYGAYTRAIDCRVFGSGQGMSYDEEDWTDRHGAPHALFTRKFPMRDASGDVTQVVTVGVDISERRAAELALERSDARLRELVNNFGSGILIHRNLVPLFANPALVRLFGYDGAEEILALPSTVFLVAPEDRAMLRALHAARLRGDAAPVDYQLHGLRKDGSRVLLSNRPFRIDWEGEPAICTLLFDVTRQKELADQLRQAQKMEAIGRLTGGIAHDFNNLMTVIVGNLQLVHRAAAGNERLRKRVAAAIRSAERGAELTQRLLAFSRRQVLDPKVANVNELMAGMETLLRRTLGEDVQVEFVLAGDLWPARIDASELESAILNIAVNARDAMPSGGRLVIESANAVLDRAYADRHAEVAPGDYAMIAITDTGSGMPPEVVDRVFEPFFTTKEVGRGTGLGLSMVHGFVKQSGGHVKIYSEPGLGTTIKIYLPRAALDEEPRRESEQTFGYNAEAAFERGDETVLVVEDQDDVRDLARTALGELGYRVLLAADAAAALAALERHPEIALLFTDVVMPGGMDGRELADIARRRNPGLKVLLTSGYTRNGMAAPRTEADPELISKPYAIEFLARRVRQTLDG